MTLPSGYRFFKPVIEQAAAEAGLDPLLVAAVCWQESNFRTDGFRFEPAFWDRYMKHKSEWKDKNPRRVSSSYGLMQVMFPVAIEDGTILADARPEVLFQPSIGIRAGCAHLKALTAWAVKLPLLNASDRSLAVLAAYNGGRGGNAAPPFRNGTYAQEVTERLAVLKKIHAPPPQP